MLVSVNVYKSIQFVLSSRMKSTQQKTEAMLGKNKILLAAYFLSSAHLIGLKKKKEVGLITCTVSYCRSDSV